MAPDVFDDDDQFLEVVEAETVVFVYISHVLVVIDHHNLSYLLIDFLLARYHMWMDD